MKTLSAALKRVVSGWQWGLCIKRDIDSNGDNNDYNDGKNDINNGNNNNNNNNPQPYRRSSRSRSPNRNTGRNSCNDNYPPFQRRDNGPGGPGGPGGFNANNRRPDYRAPLHASAYAAKDK